MYLISRHELSQLQRNRIFKAGTCRPYLLETTTEVIRSASKLDRAAAVLIFAMLSIPGDDAEWYRSRLSGQYDDDAADEQPRPP